MTQLRILVTGGSQGIGAATVEHARKLGHRVVFTGRDASRIERVAKATAAVGIVASVTSADDNARTVEACQEHMGGVDVLVNNAGYAYRGEIGEMNIDSMKAMFDVNVFGLVDIANRVAPLMKAQSSGDIFNIASTSGMKGSAGGTSYSGSKWAVRGITQCWQAELRPHGIRVACICPSEVQTEFGGRTGRDNANKLFAEDIAATIFAAIEMPRRVLWPEWAVFANNPWKND
ncbi:MAG: SDR family oxidoreductase [Gemmatimonadaceae bacterium]